MQSFELYNCEDSKSEEIKHIWVYQVSNYLTSQCINNFIDRSKTQDRTFLTGTEETEEIESFSENMTESSSEEHVKETSVHSEIGKTVKTINRRKRHNRLISMVK